MARGLALCVLAQRSLVLGLLAQVDRETDGNEQWSECPTKPAVTLTNPAAPSFGKTVGVKP